MQAFTKHRECQDEYFFHGQLRQPPPPPTLESSIVKSGNRYAK